MESLDSESARERERMLSIRSDTNQSWGESRRLLAIDYIQL